MGVENMKFEAISKDPCWVDMEFPPITECFTINVKGDNLIAMMYVAQGKGPHPTVILHHGFPGYEKNIDLAQVLRRAGYNVLIFHYRGCWGSQGAYSVKNVLEDAEAVIDHLRSDECKKSCRIDPENLILMGYSLGGFTALITLTNHPEIKSMAFLVGYNFGRYAKQLYGNDKLIKEAVEFWEGSIPPLRGITSEQFITEIIDNRENWDLVDYAEKLKGHSLLFVGGSRDKVAVVDNHYQPIVDVLKKNNLNDLTAVILDTDHDCSCKRIALGEQLLDWLSKK
jgi:pimeloyl-ACP methyl ester carboxylesterase